MKSRRWDKAKLVNVAAPTPILALPNAYDIRLEIDHQNRIAYIGPLYKRNPQSPYFTVDVKWDKVGGQTGQQIKGYDFKTRIRFTYASKGKKLIEIQWLGAVPLTMPTEPQAAPPPVVATTTYNITIL
jgi:hypothetical protein